MGFSLNEEYEDLNICKRGQQRPSPLTIGMCKNEAREMELKQHTRKNNIEMVEIIIEKMLKD